MTGGGLVYDPEKDEGNRKPYWSGCLDHAWNPTGGHDFFKTWRYENKTRPNTEHFGYKGFVFIFCGNTRETLYDNFAKWERDGTKEYCLVYLESKHWKHCYLMFGVRKCLFLFQRNFWITSNRYRSDVWHSQPQIFVWLMWAIDTYICLMQKKILPKTNICLSDANSGICLSDVSDICRFDVWNVNRHLTMNCLR